MKPSPPTRHLLITAAAIADAAATNPRDTALLVALDQQASPVATEPYIVKTQLLARGTPAEVRAHPAAATAHAISRPNSLLLPPLVNAHTHLDLTHIGPRLFDPSRGFAGFVDLVRRSRLTETAAIAESVRQGAQLALAGGVIAVGDIAGAVGGKPSLAAYEALAQNLPLGTSFIEFFAIGQGEEIGFERIFQLVHDNQHLFKSGKPVRCGLQPHAPTTIARRVYEAIAKFPLPLATHLAETPEEHAFTVNAAGPHVEFLKSLGLWDDALLADIGQDRTPVEHLEGVLGPNLLCAHVNDCSDRDLAILARSGANIAYCPRASAYFGAASHFGPHRYRDMLAAGINICLGTDSIINLPPGTTRLSTLDEARFLYQRDATDARTLLAMCTTRGAAALGIANPSFTFTVGQPIAGVLAVPLRNPGTTNALADCLTSDTSPELLVRWG